jgi:hypothetical protein
MVRPNKKICVILVTLPSLVFTPDPKLFSPIFKNLLLVPCVHSRKLQKGACGPLDSKTGGHFQKFGIDKSPRVSKLEGHF